MTVLYDAEKEAKNKRLHRISLSRAAGFDFATARTAIDNRMDYGEVRYQALGFLDARLYLLVYTEPATELSDNVIRAISLRKATKEERREYATD